jgi:hypothetical protein
MPDAVMILKWRGVWLFCGALKIRLKSTDIGSRKFVLRPTTMALIGLLEEKGMPTIALSSWSWRAILKKSGVFGPYWLPFYEAVRRGWTTDKSLVSKVTADPIMSRMLIDFKGDIFG